MIRHCVLLKLKADTTPEAMNRMMHALTELRELPMVIDYRFGPDAGLASGNADFAIVADFSDQQAYEAYATDPTHLEVLSGTIKPWVEQRTALQFQC